MISFYFRGAFSFDLEVTFIGLVAFELSLAENLSYLSYCQGFPYI